MSQNFRGVESRLDHEEEEAQRRAESQRPATLDQILGAVAKMAPRIHGQSVALRGTTVCQLRLKLDRHVLVVSVQYAYETRRTPRGASAYFEPESNAEEKQFDLAKLFARGIFSDCCTGQLDSQLAENAILRCVCQCDARLKEAVKASLSLGRIR